jgi:hypothetical protein
VDFVPVIRRDSDGSKRRPKKGETEGLVGAGRMILSGEPLAWFLLDHVPFRMVLGWYWWAWSSAVQGSVLHMLRYFRVHPPRVGIEHEGTFYVLPRYVEDLERAARLWRTIALSVVAVFTISILVPYLLMR